MASTLSLEDSKQRKAQAARNLIVKTKETAKKYFSNMTLELIYDGPYDIDSFKNDFVERWQVIYGTSEQNQRHGAQVFASIVKHVAKTESTQISLFITKNKYLT